MKKQKESAYNERRRADYYFRAMRPLPKHRADSLPYSRRATERFVSLDVVKNTDLDYAYYSDPNRVVIRMNGTEWSRRRYGQTPRRCARKGGIKSLILADVQKGDTLLYLENLDNWCKVMTADGYTGYIQTEDISEPEAIEARTAKKDSYERITRDHKINLVWHQSTSTESNDAMAEMTAEMTGRERDFTDLVFRDRRNRYDFQPCERRLRETGA